MSGQRASLEKRTLHRDPSPEDFGIVLRKAEKARADAEAERALRERLIRGMTAARENAAKTGKGNTAASAGTGSKAVWMQREGFWNALQLAVGPEQRAAVLSDAILKAAGGKKNLAGGERKGRQITLKLKDDRLRTAAPQDLFLAGGLKAKLELLPKKKPVSGGHTPQPSALVLELPDNGLSYRVFDAVCRKTKLVSSGPVKVLLTVSFIAGLATAVIVGLYAGIAAFLVTAVVFYFSTMLFQRITPALTVTAFVTGLIFGMGPVAALGMAVTCLMIAAVVEIVVRAQMRAG